jgi:hypothetical protein
MPASSSFSVILNFEPFVGDIQVSPVIGNSLSTIFQFQITYMQDEDLPLNTNIYYYQDVNKNIYIFFSKNKIIIIFNFFIRK